MRKAAFTLATSKMLVSIASENADRVYYLPNGVDPSVFPGLKGSEQKRPADYSDIQKPIILFTGNCDYRLDYELIKYVLATHQDKMLILLGPHSADEKIFDELAQYANLKFIGSKDRAELPPYLVFAQCLIIPYHCDELNKSIY